MPEEITPTQIVPDGPAATPPPTSAPSSPPPNYAIPPEIKALAEQGTKQGEAIGQLLSRSQQLEQERNDALRQLAEIQGRLPSDNQEVLTKEEAKALRKYQKLVKSPDDLEILTAQYAQTQQALAQAQRQATIYKVAEVNGLKGNLMEHVMREEVFEIDDKGQAFVKVGETERKPLMEFLAAHPVYKELLNSLKAAPPAPITLPPFAEGGNGGGLDSIGALVSRRIEKLNSRGLNGHKEGVKA